MNKDDALKAALAAGVTFADFVKAYAQKESPSAREKRLIQYARDRIEREGEIEFDDYTICSGNGPDAGGDYVLAWVWVDDVNDDDRE